MYEYSPIKQPPLWPSEKYYSGKVHVVMLIL